MVIGLTSLLHAQEMLDQEFEVRRSALGKEQNLLKLQQEALLQGGLNAHTIATTLLKELNDPGMICKLTEPGLLAMAPFEWNAQLMVDAVRCRWHGRWPSIEETEGAGTAGQGPCAGAKSTSLGLLMLLLP